MQPLKLRKDQKIKETYSCHLTDTGERYLSTVLFQEPPNTIQTSKPIF